MEGNETPITYAEAGDVVRLQLTRIDNLIADMEKYFTGVDGTPGLNCFVETVSDVWHSADRGIREPYLHSPSNADVWKFVPCLTD